MYDFTTKGYYSYSMTTLGRFGRITQSIKEVFRFLSKITLSTIRTSRDIEVLTVRSTITESLSFRSKITEVTYKASKYELEKV